jgi:uracil permease
VKGFWKSLPFLTSTLIVYAIASLLTLCGVPLIDFSVFQGVHLFQMPDFSFFHINFTTFDWSLLPQILMLFVPISIVGISEHISDHKALSAVIGTDLTDDPGLGRTLIGDGVASAIGCYLCALPNTSYGESVGTTGFSRICSKYVIALAAGIMALAGFIGPLQAFLVSIPSSIFGGCAAVLYGYIALSGIRTIANSNIDFNNAKNDLILASVLTLGVGGVVLDFGFISFGTTALALIVGVVLNVILQGHTHTSWGDYDKENDYGVLG